MLKKNKKFKTLVLMAVMVFFMSASVGCGNKSELIGKTESQFYEDGLELISPDSEYMKGNLDERLDVEGWKCNYEDFLLNESQSDYISNIEEFVELLEYGMSTGLDDETFKEILKYQKKTLKLYENYKKGDR